MAQRGDLKWGTVENLERLIDKYFKDCENNGKVPTIGGLALALDVTTKTLRYYADGQFEQRYSKQLLAAKKQLLLDAAKATGEDLEEAKENEEMENGIFKDSLVIRKGDAIDSIKLRVSNLLKSARERIEESFNQTAFGAKNPAYYIFYAKNAFGYRDQPADVNLTQNNIQLNIKLDTNNLQNVQKPPTITFSAVKEEK